MTSIFRRFLLRRTFRRNQSAIERAISACGVCSALVPQTGRQDLSCILNVGQFSSICGYDVNVLLEDLLFTRPGWRRKLRARVAVLTLVESMEDLVQLLGKDFRHHFSTLVRDPNKQASLNSLCKDLSNLRKQNDATLRETRNIALAHRDKSAAAQLEVIDNLDIDQLMELMDKFVQWNTALAELLTHILQEAVRDTAPSGSCSKYLAGQATAEQGAVPDPLSPAVSVDR